MSGKWGSRRVESGKADKWNIGELEK